MVKLEALATALPLPIKFESRRHRLQRFLSLPVLKVEKLWFPFIGCFCPTPRKGAIRGLKELAKSNEASVLHRLSELPKL